MRSRIRDGRALATPFTVQAADWVVLPYRVVPRGHDEYCARATSRLALRPNNVKSPGATVFTTPYDDECPAQGVKACVIPRKLGGLPPLKYLPEPKDE